MFKHHVFPCPAQIWYGHGKPPCSMAWNEISWKYGIADCHLWLLEVIPSPSLHIILYHSKPVEKWKADTTTINKSLIIRVWSKRPVSETDTQICSAFFNDHFCGVDVLHQCLYRGFHQEQQKYVYLSRHHHHHHYISLSFTIIIHHVR